MLPLAIRQLFVLSQIDRAVTYSKATKRLLARSWDWCCSRWSNHLIKGNTIWSDWWLWMANNNHYAFQCTSQPCTFQALHFAILAATKQLYIGYFSVCLSVCPSVCLSVCPSHLFDYVPIIVSSFNFQELLPMTKVRSIQKVKVRGQRSRAQMSQPNLTVSGL